MSLYLPTFYILNVINHQKTKTFKTLKLQDCPKIICDLFSKFQL